VGIQELVKEEGNCFSKPLIKALIETISLYPVGCYVRLNSGEIARVIKTNKKYPVRPTIKINIPFALQLKYYTTPKDKEPNIR